MAVTNDYFSSSYQVSADHGNSASLIRYSSTCCWAPSRFENIKAHKDDVIEGAAFEVKFWLGALETQLEEQTRIGRPSPPPAVKPPLATPVPTPAT